MMSLFARAWPCVCFKGSDGKPRWLAFIRGRRVVYREVLLDDDPDSLFLGWTLGRDHWVPGELVGVKTRD